MPTTTTTNNYSPYSLIFHQYDSPIFFIPVIIIIVSFIIFIYNKENKDNNTTPTRRARRVSSSAAMSDSELDISTTTTTTTTLSSSTSTNKISLPSKHFLLFCLGTRGDVQPMIAFAKELQRRGHVPCLCAADEFETFIKSYGIEFASCGLPTMREQQEQWISAKSQSEFIKAVAETYIPKYDDMGFALLQACKNQQSDVIVTGLYGIQMALDVGEFLSIPVWSVKFMPDTPTAFKPPFGSKPWAKRFLCSRTLAGILCKCRHYYRIFQAVIAANQYQFTKRQNEFRQKINLPPVTIERLQSGGKYLPTIYAFSQVLFPKPEDYPPWHRIAGFFLTPGTGNEEKLSPQLEAFLLPCVVEDNNNQTSTTIPTKDVVCITFGSMSCLDDAKCDIIRRATRAVLRLGYRVVILTGWSTTTTTNSNLSTIVGNNSNDEQIKKRVLLVESAPHELLFPRCICIIHHGGAGTTARVAFSGVPSIVVPVLRWLDQAGWANALEEFGAAIHIQTPFVEEEELVLALRRVCYDWKTSIVYSARARDLQRRMINEEAAGEGVRRAVRWLLRPLPNDDSRPGNMMVKRHDLTLQQKKKE
jgi:sterol 3beta-glucosyltransferase